MSDETKAVTREQMVTWVQRAARRDMVRAMCNGEAADLSVPRAILAALGEPPHRTEGDREVTT